jgi:hypothetical protein
MIQEETQQIDKLEIMHIIRAAKVLEKHIGLPREN